MDSEDISDSEEETMSEISSTETDNSNIEEDVFGKYDKRDIPKFWKKNADMDHEEETSLSRRKVKFNPWDKFVGRAYEALQEDFNEAVENHLEENPSLEQEEAEELAYETLEPRYQSTVMSRYREFLRISAAMRKDPTHKKIMETAKRLRMDENYEDDEAMRYAVKKRRFLLENKLNEYDQPTYCTEESEPAEVQNQATFAH